MYGVSDYLSEELNRQGERVRCDGGGGGIGWREHYNDSGKSTAILVRGSLSNRSTQSPVLTNYNAGKPC